MTVPTLCVGMPHGTLRVLPFAGDAQRHGCITTQSVGTIVNSVVEEHRFLICALQNHIPLINPCRIRLGNQGATTFRRYTRQQRVIAVQGLTVKINPRLITKRGLLHE